MTLCPECAERHGATVRFAAVIIDAELAGRRTSQASTDLKALLPAAACAAEPSSELQTCDSLTPDLPGPGQPVT